MEQGVRRRRSWEFSTHDKKVFAVGLAILAVLFPVYIDRSSMPEQELEEEPIYFSLFLPLVLLLLITGISISGYLEHEVSRFDPYWIHRVGGSPTGIIVVLILLSMVLKCKAPKEVIGA